MNVIALVSQPADLVRTLAEVGRTADASGQFPAEGIAEVHRAGLLEATVGASHGGRGLGLPELTRILAVLGRGDPSVALIASMTLLTHYREAVAPIWPDALYREVLSEGRHHPVLLNAARVEPELGSPARGGLPATVARRKGESWVISGTKRFVTGSTGLTYHLVWARTDEAAPRVGTFVVLGSSPGIRIVESWRSLGMRATVSHDVHYEDVEIPARNVLELLPAGQAEQDNAAGAAMGVALMAIYLGAAEAAQEAFHRFAHERVPSNLGHSIARTERIIAAAGEIDLLVSGARQTLLDAVDHGRGDAPRLLRARLLAGRQIQAAVALAVSTLGNPGLDPVNGLERPFRDVQSALVHAPQADTVLAILGKAALTRAAGAATPLTVDPVRKAG